MPNPRACIRIHFSGALTPKPLILHVLAAASETAEPQSHPKSSTADALIFAAQGSHLRFQGLKDQVRLVWISCACLELWVMDVGSGLRVSFLFGIVTMTLVRDLEATHSRA